jgi:hypothetical protein
MAYKTGDKFVIEIDSVMTNKKGTLYGIKGFKSLVFDDYGLEQLEKIRDDDRSFKVGDVVHCRTTESYAVVTKVFDEADFYLLFRDGSAGIHPKNEWEKTGLCCPAIRDGLFTKVEVGE